jgi:hypothetical protein
LPEQLDHAEADAILTTPKTKLGADDRELVRAKSIHTQLNDLEDSEITAAAHVTVYHRYIKLFFGCMKV